MSKFIIFLALLIAVCNPVFVSGESIADNDSRSRIVADYKIIMQMLKSGQINQAISQSEIYKLRARATFLMLREEFQLAKNLGNTLPGETVANQKYYLEPLPCPTDECILFIKILSGFKDHPL